MELPKSGLFITVFSALLRPLIRRLDKASLAKYEGHLTLSGLRDRVKILWQPHAIPHVFANNEQDLFFAQGYLHAQERLWQMDMSRRFLSGRIAEIFGGFPVPWRELASCFRNRRASDFDYFIRLIGIRHAASASLQLFREDEYRRLQAYCAGVNRYIDGCGTKLPWEFRLLRYEPEPWTPEDSLTIGKGFAFLLSTALFTRLNMIAIAARLESGQEKLRSLCPTYPEAGPTITRAVWNSTRGVWQFLNDNWAVSDWHPAGHGSNNWVIAPHRSATGAAILCNDPHLRMTLPSIWYLMHLKAEADSSQSNGYEAWGASVVGSPYIHLGHNRWMAWGATAALCDDIELYREKLHPLEPDRYLSAQEWSKIESRTETIRVRGKKPIQKTLRFTRHGPILSDFTNPSPTGEVLALRWTAHDPSNELCGVYGINQARNWDEFLQGLSHQAAPTLNYVYADRQGNIGYSLAGKVPLRPHIPSLLPMEGWSEGSKWRGYIPFGELPRIYNPPEGIIATANNRIVDLSYPHYLSHFFEPPYRVRRIKELLTAKETASVADMKVIQSDCVSLHAKALIETLKTDLDQQPGDDPHCKSAASRLLQWDGHCDENSIASTIFHVFHQRLMANLLLPELGEELFIAAVEIFNQCVTPTDEILKNPDSPWFAKQSRTELVIKSLREACQKLRRNLGDDIERWHWGRLHRLTLNHALGRLRILRPVAAIGPFPSPGDGTTINMGFYRHSNPYQHTVGPSLRFVIDLGRWEQSGFILPSGQSGHLLSPHYRDQTTLWRKFEYINLFDVEEQRPSSRLLALMPDI